MTDILTNQELDMLVIQNEEVQLRSVGSCGASATDASLVKLGRDVVDPGMLAPCSLLGIA